MTASLAGSIASLTPTVAGLFGISPPTLTDEPMLSSIGEHFRATLSGAPIDRCLIYCPDALGDHIWARFLEHVAALQAHCPERVPVRSVVPPFTPICFASMFTGSSPARHGIRKPERPVLTCDTLFDAVVRTGRRVAIVAVHGSSIDLMYRNRPLDYFTETYDAEVTTRALGMLSADQHDLIVAYHQEYDDQLHRTSPFSEECLRALRNHIASFQQLATVARTAWAKRHSALVVASDHGAHFDDLAGRGSHGLDIPDDMCVSHFCGIHASGTPV